jgi:purine-cytosine permease-like protein
MRQMVQARYAFGYWPALLPAACNCVTMLGFLAINAILGGQTLALASGNTMSWNVGIVVVGIISLLVSVIYHCLSNLTNDAQPPFS